MKRQRREAPVCGRCGKSNGAHFSMSSPHGFGTFCVDCDVIEDRRLDLLRFLEGAPTDPGPIAENLIGWIGEGLAVCARCSGRVMARGMGNAFVGWTSVFEADAPTLTFHRCDLCGVER